MIYIRDNGGPYYDRVVDFIRSDKPEALVLALLAIGDQKSEDKGPSVIMVENFRSVGAAVEIVSLERWWHEVRCHGWYYGDDRAARDRASRAAAALCLEGCIGNDPGWAQPD